ncbi:hypothetical protein NQ314_002328 [Rhamnusium bicolor]|uniref:Tectonic-1-3 domain-containing protein n=1 Tax=Rhamnusium bicolor TaxID=1586634 RepID=A0AAV8ZS59_9CUCU|nr:hypothetical protein NQ314_002328 [Rhamnusium bicolor]
MELLEDVSYEFGSDYFEFSQEFNANFWWINQTRNFSEMLSGNPGYLIGKPILIGNLVNVGNKTNVISKLQRHSSYYLENFMTLPENVNGDCILNDKNYVPVEFGFNLLTKCKMNSIVFNRRKYLNGTEICRDIQKAILKLWGITGENKTFGMFGNADANNPAEWTKILYNMNPEELLNKTTGHFSSSNNSLTCHGIATSLVIDIYHSRIDFQILLNQEKILAVTHSFGGLINRSLSYNKQKDSIYFEVDLESQVVFYDISVQKQKKYVDPPSLQIKLPYDFFYPFIKIENGVDVISVNENFYFCMCLLIVLVK